MARIRGFGSYLPARVVGNAEIGKICGADPDWIRKQTGIEERRWAAADETLADLGIKAALDCLDRCQASADEIGMVVVASGSTERRFPGPASSISAALGLAGRPAIDLPIASAGTLVGLSVASDLAARYGTILVIGTETMSRAIGLAPFYRDTAILFGDGAGACLVTSGAGFAEIRDSVLYSDGDFAGILRLDLAAPLHMDGRAVIMQVARKLPRAIQDLLDRNHCQASDIESFVLHQANQNLITKVASVLKVEHSRFFCNLSRYGNTSSASLLIAAAEWWPDEGALTGPVVFAAFGAGLNWGAMLLDPA